MIVLDTHAVVWWASGAAELSARARRTIQVAAKKRAAIVSAMSIFEIVTAVRRERLQLKLPLDQWLSDLQSLPEIRLEPVTAGIAKLAGALDPSFPGDPADRIIVATAMELRAKLVTADRRLRAIPRVETVW